MATAEVSLNQEVVAEPAAVWATLSMVEQRDKVFTSVNRAERVEGLGLEVGAKWRENRSYAGYPVIEDRVVTISEEPRRLVVSVSSPDGASSLELLINPSSLGTRVSGTYRIEDAGGMFKARARVKDLKSQLAQDLADLAKTVEARVRTGR